MKKKKNNFWVLLESMCTCFICNLYSIPSGLWFSTWHFVTPNICYVVKSLPNVYWDTRAPAILGNVQVCLIEYWKLFNIILYTTGISYCLLLALPLIGKRSQNVYDTHKSCLYINIKQYCKGLSGPINLSAYNSYKCLTD